MISIILTNYCNTPARYAHLMYSFRMLLQTTPESAQIIVVDNSNTEGLKDARGNSVSREFFAQQKRMNPQRRIDVVKTSHNLGMAEAKNLGVKYAYHEYIAFVDNDFYYNNDSWVDECIDVLDQHSGEGIVTPASVKERHTYTDYGDHCGVSRFQPGCFVVHKSTYGDYQWEDVLIPGRSMLKYFKSTPFYALKTPRIEHLGVNFNKLDKGV